MVLILDGSSDHGALLRSKLCIWLHRERRQIRFFFRKRPSYINTMNFFAGLQAQFSENHYFQFKTFKGISQVGLNIFPFQTIQKAR